jgi:hypothetical protein
MAGSYGHGYEPSSSIKSCKFFSSSATGGFARTQLQGVLVYI